ncbi:MAG: toll/interleukin-1 receptor domain-containing protein [Pyrinomonadaceae bacterium]
MPDFDFEVFISYSNQDDPWARKLYRDLVTKGLDEDRIFLDKEYLKPGVVWKPTMSNAVLNARHLIVLWSNKAQASNWVPDELSKFSLTIDPEGKGQPREDRKLIFIPLEGENNVYEHYQWINDLKKIGAYEKGIANLDENVWTDVINKVASAVTSNADFSPIMLAVLAMTRDRVDYLDLKARFPNGDTLADAVKKMGILMDVKLLDHLDANMQIGQDGQEKTLGDVLNQLNIRTQADPANPQELKILLPNGDSLGEALQQLGIMDMTQLFRYLDQNRTLTLPNGQTLADALISQWIRPRDLEHIILKVALRQYYGETPLDWRPFGSPKDKISTIMSRVKTRFNKKLLRHNMHDSRFRWQVVENYWTETDEAREEREKLARKKSVIVLDPLSLYDTEIDKRFKLLFRAFENDQALILAFAPFELPTPSGVMRMLISDKAIQIFEYFYEPDINAMKTYAKCGPDVGDMADINRWLLTALKPQTSGAKVIQDAAETAPLRT